MDIRLAILATLLLPTITLAGSDYLVGIPGLDSGATDFNQYINAVYAMFIGIAALLAVIKIIVAGVKYMFSDIVTQKSDAKKDIRSALLGLLIVLGAVLILTVINPDLTNFDVSVERQEVREVPDGGADTGLTMSVGDTYTDDDLSRDEASTSCIENGGEFSAVLSEPITGSPVQTFNCTEPTRAASEEVLALIEANPSGPVAADGLFPGWDDEYLVIQYDSLINLSTLTNEDIEDAVFGDTPNTDLTNYLNVVVGSDTFLPARDALMAEDPELTEEEANSQAVVAIIRDEALFIGQLGVGEGGQSGQEADIRRETCDRAGYQLISISRINQDDRDSETNYACLPT